MPPIYRDDPYGNYNFLLEIDGVSEDGRAARGSFSEISGLGVEIQTIEYRNGSEDNTVRKLPGLKKYPNLVCTRGFTGDDRFWQWLLTAMQGTPQRANGRIILLDEGRQEVARWHFRRAWPCKWTGPSLNAVHADVAIETLEICHEGLELAD
ncbi:MAG: phage tail protein [Gemmatimonadota bacterium]